jgi:hypothetical protein
VRSESPSKKSTLFFFGHEKKSKNVHFQEKKGLYFLGPRKIKKILCSEVKKGNPKFGRRCTLIEHPDFGRRCKINQKETMVIYITLYI